MSALKYQSKYQTTAFLLVNIQIWIDSYTLTCKKNLSLLYIRIWMRNHEYFDAIVHLELGLPMATVAERIFHHFFPLNVRVARLLLLGHFVMLSRCARGKNLEWACIKWWMPINIQKQLDCKWYFVTKIVLIYCEKKLF